MNEPEHTDSNQNNPTSYQDQLRLNAFLRDAEAIISAEKGLNPTSRLKLESLAKHQRLSADLFAIAVQKLQEVEQQDGKLSRYEQAFADFLDQEFEQMRGNVLSMRAEQRAIELAETKYQLSAARTEQLIAQRTKSASIERIARSDAENYAEQFIREQVRDRLALDEGLYDSIVERGQKLGLAREQIDETIEQLLLQNRRQQRAKQKRRFLIGSTPIALLVGFGAIAYSLGWIPIENKPPPPPAFAEPESPVILEPNTSQIAWLSPSTVELVARLTKETNATDILASKLLDENADTRANGYRELAELTCEDRAPDDSLRTRLFGNLFFEEPDSHAVLALIEPMTEFLHLPSQGTSLRRDQFEQQYRVNRLLASIYFFEHEQSVLQKLGGPRRKSLAERIQHSTGVSPQGLLTPEYLQQSEPAIAVNQWNDLNQNCWSQPGQVAALVQPLTDLTRLMITNQRLARLRTRLLQSLLEIQPTQWLNLRQPLSEAIAVADETELREWVAIVLDSQHEPLQNFIGPMLLKKLDRPSESNSNTDLLAALASYVNDFRNTILQPLLIRNSDIESKTVHFLESLASLEPPATPDGIGQLAMLTNLNFAICQQLQRGEIFSDADFSIVDLLLATPNIRLRKIVTLPGAPRPATAIAVPTASDTNRKAEALARLNSTTSDQSSVRIRYLSELAKIAERFDDLTYGDASVLAKYLLRSKSDPEMLNVQQRITSFAHWPTLGLAIADQIEASPPSRDIALTIARLFFDAEFETVATAQNWPATLRTEIIKLAFDNLSRRNESGDSHALSDWMRLEYYLADVFQQRSSLSRQNEAPIVQAVKHKPAEVLLRLIELRFDNSTSHVATIRRAEKATNVIRSGQFNELQQSIMADSLWLELTREGMSKTTPSGEDQVETLIRQILVRFKPETLGDQLFLAELDSLQFFSAQRRLLVANRTAGDRHEK